MTAPKPDVYRVMAEAIWEHINGKQIAIHPDTIEVIADAVRTHTIVPELVRMLEIAGLKVDDNVLAIQINRCLSKAKGRK